MLSKPGSCRGHALSARPQRTLVPIAHISGVHLLQRSTTFHTRESKTYPYNTADTVYPIRESIGATKNANRHSSWRSNQSPPN
jgi:hypothetical protein